jgi:hypothetical protein
LKNGRGFKGRIKGGKRKDLESDYFRSKWEANYARYLNQMEVVWEYEKKVFWFDGIKSGTNNYTPDFYLPDTDEWVEVKGQWDSKSKTKLRRFKKHHPEEFAKLWVVTSDIWGKSKTAKSVRRFLLCDLRLQPNRIGNYTAIAKKFKDIIPSWEK